MIKEIKSIVINPNGPKINECCNKNDSLIKIDKENPSIRPIDPSHFVIDPKDANPTIYHSDNCVDDIVYSVVYENVK